MSSSEALRPIHEQFRDSVARDPTRVALVAPGEELTYEALASRVARLAREIADRSPDRARPVAVCLERGSDLVASVVAVLETGRTYVPLDRSAPAARRAYMLADARAGLLIADTDERPSNGDVAFFDPRDTAVGAAAEPIATDVALHDVAYGIYTSGSTGTPKCVAVSHASLAAYPSALGGALGIGPGDRYLHTASFAFSASLRQLLVPLARGATVVLATTEHVRDPLELVAWMRLAEVTVFDTVPTYLRQCISSLAALGDERRRELRPDTLRLVLTTGEPLPTSLVRAWRATVAGSARVYNLYGQTETTGTIALHEASPDDSDETVPIGKPLAGTEAVLLGPDLSPAAAGETVELLVGGRSLAVGYFGRPELTSERFVPDPRTREGRERLYRTGDIVRVRADGTLSFVTRADFQVKIHGVRVELGEIEAELLRCAGVEAAAVVVRDDAPGGPGLVAYVVLDPPAKDASTLRAALRQRLTDVMIPKIIVALERLPRTTSGKIDRRALPPPPSQPETPADADASATRLERLIAAAWSRALGPAEIDLDADFFELGGDSIQAMEMIADLQRQLPVQLPLIAAFFGNPTVRSLARAIIARLGPEEGAALNAIDERR